jgi:hypothetical protein
MNLRRLAPVASMLSLIACTGGPSEPLDEPFPGEREEALRSEECPTRISVDLSAIAIPDDRRIVEDLTRDLRAKGLPEPAKDAEERLELVRPWLPSVRKTSSLSLLGIATEPCGYRASEHRFRLVRTRPENGGPSALALRLRASPGGPNTSLWFEVPLESLNARSIVVDTRRTPALFAQSDAATIALGTFTASARVVE